MPVSFVTRLSLGDLSGACRRPYSAGTVPALSRTDSDEGAGTDSDADSAVRVSRTDSDEGDLSGADVSGRLT